MYGRQQEVLPDGTATPRSPEILVHALSTQAARVALAARILRLTGCVSTIRKVNPMNKLLIALIAAGFASTGFAASHAAKEMKKEEAKPAAAAASAAMKKDEKKADAKPAAKAEEKKEEPKKP
jgi:flagellar biosynthesis component FlhA